MLPNDTGLREVAGRQGPIAFTHHTLYEHSVRYLPVGTGTPVDHAA